MSSTTGVDRRGLLDDLADRGDRLVEAAGDLAQGEDRRDEVVDEREHDRSRPRRSGRLRLQAWLAPLLTRRRRSRRASRRSRRRSRPSRLTWSWVVSSSGTASRSLDPLRRGVPDRVDARHDRSRLREHAARAGSPRSARRRAAGRCRRSTRASSRPPLGHDRGLAGDARQRAQDDVELGVDRLDRRLERAQVLRLDGLERGAQRGQVAGDRVQPARAPRSAPRPARPRRRPRAGR